MTDGAPSAPPVGAVLDELIHSRGLLPSTVVRVRMRIDEMELARLIEHGRLDAVHRGGQLFLAPDQVRIVDAELAEQRDTELVALIRPMTELLTDYLAEVTVTMDYDVARETGRPLVLARRGRARRDPGETLSDASLYGHAVAVRSSALATFAQRPAYSGTVDQPGPLAQLPTGPPLAARFAMLDGVSLQQHVTPAGTEDRRSRRVANWLRIDPTQWTVTADRDIVTQLRELAALRVGDQVEIGDRDLADADDHGGPQRIEQGIEQGTVQLADDGDGPRPMPT